MLSSTSAPTVFSTTDAVTAYPPNKNIITNKHATNGLLYYNLSDFDTGSYYIDAAGARYTTAGAQIELYQSWDGSNWYLNTALPRTDTAVSGYIELDNLGLVLRLGYVVAASAVSIMSMLELYEER